MLRSWQVGPESRSKSSCNSEMMSKMAEEKDTTC